MKNRFLPTEITINDKIYPINQKGDYGVILDILAVLEDKELQDSEKAYTALLIFYDFNLPKRQDELEIALKEMMSFINCGDDVKDDPSNNNKRPLMNWNKDFPLLIAPINRVLGYDIREKECVHWWTIVSAYMEIGECTFQTIVNIRSKKQRGKKLEKWEEEFYRDNRDKIDLPINFSAEEEQAFKDIFGVDFK